MKKKKVKRKGKNQLTEKIKLRVIFFVLLGVWSLDYLSTFIALNFFHGSFIEANPFQAQFFNLGWYGWIISVAVTTAVLFVLTLIIGFGGRLVEKAEDREDNYKYYNFFITYCCGIFSAYEFVTIISNVALLLGLNPIA